jgi:DNA-binding NarL/FixJ family response regulator
MAASSGVAAPIRVVVAEDNDGIRAGLRELITADGRLEIAGEASDGAELLQVLASARCQAVLLDLVMPRRTGLQVLEDLAAARARPAVVVMSMHDDAAHLDRALALGAQGYLLKSASIDEIVTAVTHATLGGIYLQPILAKGVIQRHLLVSGSRGAEAADLSRRQLELLRALAIGMTNKEIAGLLDLAEGTINGYMKDLFARLGVASRAAAVSAGMRRGLIA